MPRRSSSETYSSPTWEDASTGSGRSRSRRSPSASFEEGRHSHRTAKVVELVGTSRTSFEDAIQGALEDARATTRGISGCEVERMSIKCRDGEVLEYHVAMKMVFGVERTPPA